MADTKSCNDRAGVTVREGGLDVIRVTRSKVIPRTTSLRKILVVSLRSYQCP